MKIIKTNTPLKTLQGEPIKDPESKKEVTVGQVLSNILSGRVKDAHWGYRFAKKFANDKEVELQAGDIVMIIDEIKAAGYASLVAGQLMELLDGKEK